MEINDIKTLLSQEAARIKDPSKGNGKNIVLTINTSDGKALNLKTGMDGSFFKAPEIINGLLKIGIADPTKATSETTDTGSALTVITHQPVSYYYLPVENIVSMRYDFDVTTSNIIAMPQDTSENGD